MDLLRGELFGVTVRCNFNKNRKADLVVESVFPGAIPEQKVGSFFYPSDSRGLGAMSVIPTSDHALALPLARDMMDLYIFMLACAEAQGDQALRDELAETVMVSQFANHLLVLMYSLNQQNLFSSVCFRHIFTYILLQTIPGGFEDWRVHLAVGEENDRREMINSPNTPRMISPDVPIYRMTGRHEQLFQTVIRHQRHTKTNLFVQFLDTSEYPKPEENVTVAFLKFDNSPTLKIIPGQVSL